MRLRIPVDVEMISTTYFVYDQETGEIVYSRKLTALSDAKTRPAEKTTEAALIKEARSVSGKDRRRLAVIILPGNDQIEGVVHKVDVAKKKLVTVKRGDAFPAP